MRLSTAIKLVTDELDRAFDAHGTMSCPHYGYAVLLEEVDELWDEIKADQGATHRGASEAVQVAAMALRYLVDLCPEQEAVAHEQKVVRHVERGFVGGYSG